jgi:hypothetical protein
MPIPKGEEIMKKTNLAFDDIDQMQQTSMTQVAKKCGLFERLYALQTNENARHLIGARIVFLKGLLIGFAENEQNEWRQKCEIDQ